MDEAEQHRDETRRDVRDGRARNCCAALDSFVATAADYPPSDAS